MKGTAYEELKWDAATRTTVFVLTPDHLLGGYIH
jgi:hypothetical protein